MSKNKNCLIRLLGIASLVVLNGCLDNIVQKFISVPGDDTAFIIPDGGFDSDGIIVDRLSMRSITPEHGPFVGGTIATISGSGFTKEIVVRIGGKEVPETQINVLSPLALLIKTPAGEVGFADVEISLKGEIVNLSDGYYFDPVYLDPTSGPSTGGTLVTLHGVGTNFNSAMTLTLGGNPFTDVEIISTTALRAKTPSGSDGPADLVVGNIGSKDITVKDAYLFYPSSNPVSGGVGGGPINGTLTVSVLNWLDRSPIDEAQVIVQKNRDLTLVGTTNNKGFVVFSQTDLTGPVTVTAGKEKHQTATLVDFDARDVTIFLLPFIPPSPGPLLRIRMAQINGNILFGGPTGTGSPEWKIVPEPKDDQIKRAYVFVSNESIAEEPAGRTSDAIIDYEYTGNIAWPFTLYARLGTIAIYAVAGLYNKTNATFEPYAMGITRGIVTGAGDLLTADITVDIPLTQKITVKLQDLPEGTNRHRMRLGIDLGADGVVLFDYGQKQGEGVPVLFEFGRMPKFSYQGLMDASYTADILMDSTSPSELPVVHGTARSVQPINQTIILDKFVGVAKPITPQPSGILLGNTLRWKNDGAPASIAITLLTLTDGTPLWQVISNGTVTEVSLPDPQTVGLPQWPKGPMLWIQWLAHLPDYDFNEYNYRHLSSSYWDRWSINLFSFVIAP